MDDKELKHESWGMISLTRYQGGYPTFFGSGAEWNGGLELTIKHGSVSRDLGRDWYRAHDTLIQVRMTPVQFADLMTYTNVAGGVPCTIEYIKDEGNIEYRPMESTIRKINGTIDAEAENKKKAYEDTIRTIKGLVEDKKLSKSASEKILSAMLPLRDESDFYRNSMQKELDKMTNEAKASLRSYIGDKMQLENGVNIDKMFLGDTKDE